MKRPNNYLWAGITCMVVVALIFFIGIPGVLLSVYGLVGNDSISTGQALLKVDTAKVIINILFGLMAALFVIGVALLVIGSIKHGDKTGYLARSKAKSATNSGLRPKR